MKFIDLAAQQKHIREDVDRRIKAVLDHGNYIMGPEVFELEEKLAAYVDVKHCISCASGTDALLMALMAKGVRRGDAVFTTPFTFIATAEVIALLGATPVFVDIDPNTYNIDPDKLRSTIEQFKAGILPNGKSCRGLTAKGIIPVDLFGLSADYDRINKIAQQQELFVLEDAAQSFGGEYKGRKTCGLAEIAVTSFFPAKPLGCYGDGGAVFTDDESLAELMRSIRIHGKGSNKYVNVRVGINGRLDTMQAAVILAKLRVFDNELRLRQYAANRYFKAVPEGLSAPVILEGYSSAWAQYTLRSAERARYVGALEFAGIPSMIYYPKPLHLQKAFECLGYRQGMLPVSEIAAKSVFSLPMGPYITADDQGRVTSVLKKAHSCHL